MLSQFARSCVLGAFLLSGRFDDQLPVVEANDNRAPAGVLENGVLKVNLVAEMARWYPESSAGPFAEVVAFAEEGKAPQVPAPLLRVPEGTIIEASVRNALADSTIWIHGLVTRPASVHDSIPVAPGETKLIRFAAGAVGTYLYGATPGFVDPEVLEREQLAGGLIVDPRGQRPDDRVLIINIWGDPVGDDYRNILAINGKAWPHTERLRANVGDSVRWRVINASGRPHPMHLHGFFFRVTSLGTLLADSALGERSRLVVTENLEPGRTMSLVWTPERPGNWLFHCHLVFHVIPGARLDAAHTEHSHAANPIEHMAGLVMGITVDDPRGMALSPTGNPRLIRLYANERPRVGRTAISMSYVTQHDKRVPSADSVELPGAPLILRRGEPTSVTVINNTHMATSVHWHGIELESFSDGVAGWSGSGVSVAPMIAPKDSFTARLTLPRAGTFIYHTHLNDVEQLTSGAYGPIIVLEKDERYDPRADHVFTAGWDGADEPPRWLVNGDSAGTAPLEIEAGRTHRLRFVNIGAAGTITFAVRKDSVPVQWVPRAKDGADLPLTLRSPASASRPLSTGETFDVEWNPQPGEYQFTLGLSKPYRYSRKIIVR